MKFMILFLLLFPMLPGCINEPVPAGHIGRTWEPRGFSDELLRPGRHACWGRCQMYHMETTDQVFKLPMNILCADSLNFQFEMSILVSLDQKNQNAIKAAFENLKPEKDHMFTLVQLYNMYIEPVAKEEAQKVVSRYLTTEIVLRREQIIEAVRAAVVRATANSILQVKQVNVGNLDFPDVITEAQEAKAKRLVEIETARAEGEKQAAEAQARLKLATIEAQVSLLKAQSEADANSILGNSVTPQLLAWRQWDVMKAAAEGNNNMIIVPYTDASNTADMSKWAAQSALDAALLERINAARAAAPETTP